MQQNCEDFNMTARNCQHCRSISSELADQCSFLCFVNLLLRSVVYVHEFQLGFKVAHDLDVAVERSSSDHVGNNAILPLG